MREPRLLLAAGRALLLQAAHPLVAQGAIDHSTYKTDPYGRLERTVLWVTVVCFGTTREAERISGRVTGLHRRVSGELPAASATARVPAGTLYTAGDPALLRWVHASFVDTMLVAHDALVGGLTEADRDAFVREWDAVAQLMGLPRGGWATDTLAFIATGLLPADLRRGYGLSWNPAQALAFAALTRSLRLATAALPRRLRISPVYDLALARSEGRWPESRAA
jgi:uncharacterized protein (DUF2236 family)